MGDVGDYVREAVGLAIITIAGAWLLGLLAAAVLLNERLLIAIGLGP